MCDFSLQLFFLWNISHSKKNSARYDQKWLVVFMKVSVIIVRFKWNFNSRDRFSKNSQIWNFIKIRPVGGKLFHEERQADMTKLNSRFSQFCERA